MSAEIYDVVGGYRVTDHVSASLRAGLLGIEPGQGATALRTDLSPELSASPAMAFRHDYFRVAGELALDTRDRPRNPHSGQFASALLEAYDDRTVGGSFQRATLDLRHFQALGSTRHVLAVRALGMATSTADGTPVPFYLQRSLGGNQILRSYESERFSGNKVVAFSTEYRFEALRRLELAAFYDVGRAWDGHPSLVTPGFVSSYGLGARIKSSERIMLRLDVARGREGMRTNATIGYSF
jgi:outer membrane protein assembly factor BamA